MNWLTTGMLAIALASCGPDQSVNLSVDDGGTDGRVDGNRRDAADALASHLPDGGGAMDGGDVHVPTSDASILTDAMTIPDAPVVVDAPPLPPDAPPPPPDIAPPPPDAPPPPPDLLPVASLTVTSAASVAMTDLTTAGTVDWIQWGLTAATSVNRKKTGGSLITMIPLNGASPLRYADRPVVFSWTDGTPTASSTGTNSGLDAEDGDDTGFQIRAPGNVAKPRTLKLYVGAWGAHAKMNIHLDPAGGTPYVDTSFSAGVPGSDRIYTVTFQTVTAKQAVVVDWTVESTDVNYGNVTIQAAALSE